MLANVEDLVKSLQNALILVVRSPSIAAALRLRHGLLESGVEKDYEISPDYHQILLWEKKDLRKTLLEADSVATKSALRALPTCSS